MMSETVTQTRQPRAAEQQQRRRRRESLGADRNLKLHVPADFKEPDFEYRFVNDRPGRVQQLYSEDWDKVSASPDVDTNSLGTTVERAADKMTGEKAVLMRKPRKFFEEDQKEKQRPVDAIEKALRQGPADSSEGLSGRDNAYVPGGKNTIGR